MVPKVKIANESHLGSVSCGSLKISLNAVAPNHDIKATLAAIDVNGRLDAPDVRIFSQFAVCDGTLLACGQTTSASMVKNEIKYIEAIILVQTSPP
jgi:hypothetical protein